MTHPMPDQTDTPPPKRMTTAEVAALAQAIDGRLDDLSAVVTDVSTRLQDLGTGSTSSTSSVTHDAVDRRIHEALAPLHDEVHELRRSLQDPAATGNLSAILARLETAERVLTTLQPGAITEQVAQELHPAVADLRRRLAAVEEAAKAFEADPVSHTLAEDHLADQVEAQVDRTLAKMFEDAGLTPAQLADLSGRLQRTELEVASIAGLLSSHPNASRVIVAGGVSNSGGLGAARKVLELMRMVTHIGKDRQADMGQGGKFRFRGIDEAMDAVGHAMREVGLILAPEVLKDETTHNAVTKSGTGQNGRAYESTIIWTTSKLTMRYTFVDPEDGSTHAIEMIGEGRDASDKSTSKAGSMAFKYALLQALCIPVNGLDDSDAAPPQVMENEHTRPVGATQRPAEPSSNTDQKADNLARAKRAGEALSAIRNVYRVEGGPQAQYNRLVQIMNQVKSEGLLDVAVEGATLNHHGEAAMRTLQAPPPPDDARASTEPPEPPEDYR